MKSTFIKITFGFALATFLSIPIHCSSQNSILALSKTDHTLAIVDAKTLKVMARVPVGPDPHEVIASADGKTAYVSNMGGDKFHELNIIDLATAKALPSFDTGPLIGLHGLVFVGGKVWFTAQGSKTIGRYDPKTAKVDWVMGTGQDRTHMIFVKSDEKQIYTTNMKSGTVSIFENQVNQPSVSAGDFDWVQTVIPVAKGSEGFDVSPNGRELWTAASEDGSVSVIDINSKKRIATIDAKVIGANRLKFSPDGKLVLITSLRNGDLFIFDAITRKEIKRLPIGHGAAGILLDPDGSRAFAACTADNYIAVIDLKTLEVTGHIDVGGGPDGLAWAVRP